MPEGAARPIGAYFIRRIQPAQARNRSDMAHPTKFQKYLDGALSSHDQVARVLGGEILAGIYPAGTKLPHESVILSRFGVSRTVLREVLKTLTAKGLLYSRTRVGTMVLDASHWNYFDAQARTLPVRSERASSSRSRLWK